MKASKIQSYSRYLEIVEQYGQKGCATNDFIQREADNLIHQGLLYEICGKNNAFLLVQKHTCFRVYYYLNDYDEGMVLDDGECVIEILYRGEATFPRDEIGYFERNGFRSNLKRDQYSGVYKDLKIGNLISPEIVIDYADSLQEVEEACMLFNHSFDKYSGDYISDKEFEALLENKQIIIAKDTQGGFLGALHQTVENRVAWISHVAVMPEARGRGVGTGLMETFVQNNHVDDKTRYMLWVQRINEPAVRMYQNAGFIFTGKTTFSMIKTK